MKRSGFGSSRTGHRKAQRRRTIRRSPRRRGSGWGDRLGIVPFPCAHVHWLSGALRAMLADLATFAPIVASLGAVNVLVFRLASPGIPALGTFRCGMRLSAARKRSEPYGLECGARSWLLASAWIAMHNKVAAAPSAERSWQLSALLTAGGRVWRAQR